MRCTMKNDIRKTTTLSNGMFQSALAVKKLVCTSRVQSSSTSMTMTWSKYIPNVAIARPLRAARTLGELKYGFLKKA
jgi:hypothetical protein